MAASPLKCQACGRECRSNGGLAKHVRTHGISAIDYYEQYPLELKLRLWQEIDITAAGCWEHRGRATSGMGYRQIRVAPHSVLAHVAAWWAWYGRWPTGVLMHQCDNPACCNPAHLIEGTHAQNMQERNDRGRTAHGERTDVDLIRLRHSWGWTESELARTHGLSPSAAGKIARGDAYAHVPAQPDGNFIPW